MAFMGRGEIPSISGGGFDGRDTNKNNDNYNNNDEHRFVRSEPFFWNYYFIPLDNTYVIIQMIITFIILIVGVTAFVVTYKSNIKDPIENTKKLFMSSYLITIFILLLGLVIANFIQTKMSTIKKLTIVLILSIISMIIFFSIRLNLDSTYNETRFLQFYMEQNKGNVSKEKKRIDVMSLSIKSEKQYYIDECMKMYNIFIIKSYAILGLHLLLNIFIVFQIVKANSTQTKKEQISKDDAILFDKEQNVKF